MQEVFDIHIVQAANPIIIKDPHCQIESITKKEKERAVMAEAELSQTSIDSDPDSGEYHTILYRIKEKGEKTGIYIFVLKCKCNGYRRQEFHHSSQKCTHCFVWKFKSKRIVKYLKERC